MMRKSFCCLLFIIIFVLPLTAKTIKVKSYKSLQRQFVHTNSTYILYNTFNLKGDTLTIPYGCTLVFKKGGIKNGVVVGDSSRVEAGKNKIFNTVSILGSWKNDNVYSEWLDFIPKNQYDNRNNFQNLMTLSNGKRFKRVYMQEGEFGTSVQSNGYGLRIPSNTYFHSQATIKELTNDFKYACLISIKFADNVTVDGGEFIGDLKEHIDKGGEWSHGIECRGSTNIKIKNVVSREFWGDGIDVIDGYDKNQQPTINCRNVTIENAKCYYNRRTGIGIEAVTDCKVRNCECRYTGQQRGTLPMAGLSIEAWSKVNEKIKNIEISDCVLLDNKENDLICYANGPFRKEFVKYNNCISVRNCKMGYFFVSYTNGIILDNCVIEKSKGYEHEYVQGLQYKNCVLKGKRIDKKVTKLPKSK